MNNFIKFTLVTCLFFVCGKFYAQTPAYTETEKVDTFFCNLFFSHTYDVFDPEVKNNAEMISHIDSIFRNCKEENVSYYVNITGFASIDGQSVRNIEISKKRALAVENFLLEMSSHPDPTWFHAEGLGESWEEFRDAVSQDDQIPAQQQLINIIDNNSLSDNAKKLKIKQLANGATFNYLKTDILPSSCKVEILLKYTVIERTPVPAPIPEPVPEVVEKKDTVIDTIPLPVIPETPPTPQPARQGRWAVKTNLIYWLAAGIINAGAEYTVNDQLSIDFPITYSPYTVKNDWRIRTLSIQPEARWWLDQTMKGHFFGLHAHVAYYNISTNNLDRFQDKGGKTPLWGFGLSYGYAFHLKNHWNMEATIGAGYAHLNYDVFYNVPNGARYTGSIKNYWGITRAAVNLIYLFNE